MFLAAGVSRAHSKPEKIDSAAVFDQGEEALSKLIQGLRTPLQLGAQNRAFPADPEKHRKARAVGIGIDLPGASRRFEAAHGAHLAVRQVGAEGYLAKPVSIGPFMAAVKGLVGQ